MVGQQFIALLADHPWFKVEWLGASQRSEGKAFRDAAAWRLPNRLPDEVANKVVEAATPGTRAEAGVLGTRFLGRRRDRSARSPQAGHIVVSNSRNYRMFDTVPLLIPEVNADHLALLDAQGAAQGWKGRIITNPNCATIVLAMALAPLRQFGLKTTMVTTLQAISGAGYPGVPSWDILGNVIPHIGGGEEEKIETETRKILGIARRRHGRLSPGEAERDDDACAGAERPHRIDFGRDSNSGRRRKRSSTRGQSFRGRPQELELPSAPPQPIVVSDRGQSSAAAARRQSRRRHDGHGRTPAAVPALRLQVRGARPQHDSRRRRRGDSQRRADAPRGTAVNVIMKFGGTSVADAEAMTRVINIVRDHIARYPDHTLPVVVVSAMSKVTDRLVETGRLAGQGEGDQAAQLLHDLLTRHISVAVVARARRRRSTR